MSDPLPASDRGLYALDNVRLDLPVALAGSRSLAAIVDYTLLGIVAAALVSGALVVAMLAGTFESAAVGWVFALGLLALFVLEAGWFAVQEIAMAGQTLGKRLVGLRAVALRGGRASPLALILRNLVRSLDLLFGMWFLVFDPSGRRIGDRLAGTLVVHEPAAHDETEAVSRVPAGWGAGEIETVESLLAALDGLPVERAEELSRRVLDRAERDHPGFVHAGAPGVSATTRLMASFGRGGGQPPSERADAV